MSSSVRYVIALHCYLNITIINADRWKLTTTTVTLRILGCNALWKTMYLNIIHVVNMSFALLGVKKGGTSMPFPI